MERTTHGRARLGNFKIYVGSELLRRARARAGRGQGGGLRGGGADGWVGLNPATVAPGSSPEPPPLLSIPFSNSSPGPRRFGPSPPTPPEKYRCVRQAARRIKKNS